MGFGNAFSLLFTVVSAFPHPMTAVDGDGTQEQLVHCQGEEGVWQSQDPGT